VLGHLPIVAPAVGSFPADRPGGMFWACAGGKGLLVTA
jgi:hypothetical protein